MNLQQQLRDRYEKTFLSAYERLNEEQRMAVDHIEGAVMVIAGPGTGKTQILAVRIGKILKDTDTQAHQILCLTYTDAATNAMRSRLVEIIGPDAHRVNIHTFHGFCNQVIQEHLDYFGDYRQLDLITDLEKIDLYKDLLQTLPNDHLLKRLKVASDFESRRLQHLFSLMKKEHYRVEDISSAIERYLNDVTNDESMYYKRSGKGYQKGDFKQQAYDKIERQMRELQAGADLYPRYEQLMLDMGRYDYDDMILWVIRAFEEEGQLLSEYQERYQYFLVDEFQDTNGAQKHILDLLISYWGDNPNVFVVGDDDQAIYKFQGANLSNITDFKDQYKPETVVLKQNYRSSQRILDAAMGLIAFNQERIVNRADYDLDKNLVAMGRYKDEERAVVIRTYDNTSHEQAHIAHQLERYHKAGKDLGKIAILYRKHQQIEKLVEVLEKKGVPLNIRKRVDILKIPLIRNVLNILRFINDTYQGKGFTDRALFELMHYNFFKIQPADISKLIWYHRQISSNKESEESSHLSLFALLNDIEQHPKLRLSSQQEVLSLRTSLNKWVGDIRDVTLQMLFQNIMSEGYVLDYILRHADKAWMLQVVGTLFDLIKDETAKKPEMQLEDLLTMIDKMIENKVELGVNKVIQSKGGLNFTTAHSSKGMEYEEVIIIGATKDKWNNKRGNSQKFSFPPEMIGGTKNNDEDERRLMYVAMTRAERALDISYSLHREDGKQLSPSAYVDEVRLAADMDVTSQIVPAEIVEDFQANILMKGTRTVTLLDHNLIDRRLEGYKLSVTHLNKYMKCPITFYFESILQVPMARTKYLGFGRAVHYGLEMFHHDLSEGKNPSKGDLISYFDAGMAYYKSHFTPTEFKDISAYGVQILSAYYTEYLVAPLENVRYHMEVKIDQVEYKGIPLKGVLDLVTQYRDHVSVTDYKTGNPTTSKNRPKLYTPTDKYPNGGDYWRQIVFYKILCDSDPKRRWNMTDGTMDFVEPDRKTKKFTRKKYVVSHEQIEIVGRQIDEVWQRIHDHEFDNGCGEEDCYWCAFINNDTIVGNPPIRGAEMQVEEIET